MNFKVYRGSWARGGYYEKYGLTSLFNDKDNMCCLGQTSFQCGVPLEKLREQSEPIEVETEELVMQGFIAKNVGGWTDVYSGNSSFSKECMHINDNDLITDKQREALLIEEFKKNGHTLKFVPGKAPWFATEGK